MNDFAYMGLADLSSAVKNKKVSPVELTRYFLDRIEKRNPSLNAVVYTDSEKALIRAKEIEDRIMAGEDVGIMAGIPTLAKDFIPSLPGWKGSFGGVKGLSELPDAGYVTYTKRFIEEGAVFLGKTNSPSFAFRGTCDNRMYGATRNPFDITKNSGGSSGGSSAAVADGMIPIAHGSDGGGSIRIPAAWCGLFGYKASVGTISIAPRPNAFGAGYPYVFDGAQTRSVEDAALALNVMAGYDPFDPKSLDHGVIDYTNALKGNIKGKRIGFTSDFGIFPVEQEIKDVVEKAVKLFEQAGAIVEPVEFQFTHSAFELAECWDRLISIGCGLDTFESLKAAGFDLLKDYAEDLPKELVYWISDAYTRNYTDFFHDQSMRTEVYDELQRVLSKYDYIVSPVTACNPVDNDPGRNTLGPTEINGVKVEPLIGWCLTFFCNFTGHPAASIPAGMSKSGLPIGMQIIGRRFDDMSVLTASAAYERINPWTHIYRLTQERKL